MPNPNNNPKTLAEMFAIRQNHLQKIVEYSQKIPYYYGGAIYLFPIFLLNWFLQPDLNYTIIVPGMLFLVTAFTVQILNFMIQSHSKKLIELTKEMQRLFPLPEQTKPPTET